VKVSWPKWLAIGAIGASHVHRWGRTALAGWRSDDLRHDLGLAVMTPIEQAIAVLHLRSECMSNATSIACATGEENSRAAEGDGRELVQFG
jgi:hypothetical protein